MADSPSEALLSWLRDLIKRKGLNTAAVAERAHLPRARVRKLLAGTEPMLVDELMMLSNALEIDPADMGLAEASAEAPALPAAPAEPPEGPNVDGFGNHPEQLFKVAFGLGVDFFFLSESRQLADSGVPQTVLKQYDGREIPIKLDAAYHSYNNPRYSDHGITLTLSFDQLYECSFPWSAIKQFILFPVSPEEPVDGDEPPEEEEDPSPGIPHLRLVT